MFESIDQKQLDIWAEGMNRYIRETENAVQAMRNILEAINELRNAQERKYLLELRQTRELLDMMVRQFELNGMPSMDVYGYKMDRLSKLVDSENWPMALDPDYISIGDESRRVVARYNLDLFIVEQLDGLRVLDFGCGGGFLAEEAAKRGAAMAVGYDIVEAWRCPAIDNFLLTNNLDEVKAQGPYDVIVFHDVLDHCQDPVEALNEARNLLSARGKIYARNHPWCSRHGGHLYEYINKAYVHILFDEIEQMRLFGHTAPFVQKLTHPIKTYRQWFAKAGLEIQIENIIREKRVDDMFMDPEQATLQERLLNYWKNGDAHLNMCIDFVNYILVSENSDKNVL